jgi:peptide/nickel transport system permease protein
MQKNININPDSQELKINEATARVTEFQRFRRVFFGRPVVIVGFVVIFLLIFTAILAQVIAPYDPYQQDLKVAVQGSSFQHWLGTDQLGRDVLSRIIYGTRTSLQVGLIAVGIASAIGMSLGLLTGYFGGWFELIVMRIIDAMMSIPNILLALVFAAMLGGGLKNVMIAVGVAMIPSYCRLMRSQVLVVRQTDYVLAAHTIGCSNIRVMFRHIFPNSLPPLIVLITLNLGGAIMAEAGLSFLGMGISPPGAAWGSMVNDGYKFLLMNPVISIAPGVCIMVVVLAFNMVGDGLRDALDPRLRGTI